jgi:uncharacterized protein
LEPLAKIIYDRTLQTRKRKRCRSVNENVKGYKGCVAGSAGYYGLNGSQKMNRPVTRYVKLFTEGARLSSKILTSKKDTEEAQKYRDYFDFSEPLSASPSHRILGDQAGRKRRDG